MAELIDTGLVTRTQAEILEQIEADQRAEISATLDQSASSPLGQLNLLFARSLALVEEALAAQYAAIDPDGASGDALDRLAALTGTVRESAQPTRVTVLITIAAGTYPAGSLRAAPAGRPTEIFANVAELVTAGPSANIVFEALEPGPTQVAANQLQIAGPVAGWSSIVSHPAATPGRARETDEELRLRRTREVERPGSSSVAGIAADLSSAIPGIVSVTVTENDTDVAVDSIPPHSIETVVFGPALPTTADDDAVAAQIFASKAAGIGTYGTTSRTVTDEDGVDHVVRFTRPATVPVTVAITVAVQSSAYAGDVALADEIAARAQAELVPGLDVSWSMVASWAHGVPGVLRVTAITVAGVSFGTQAITSRQIASIVAGGVTVTSVGATP